MGSALVARRNDQDAGSFTAGGHTTAILAALVKIAIQRHGDKNPINPII
jgi:hypothetical protein